MSESESEFERDIREAARQQHKRKVMRGVTNVEEATTYITLGCGHVLTFTFASHPVAALSTELRDEMDCDQCR